MRGRMTYLEQANQRELDLNQRKLDRINREIEHVDRKIEAIDDLIGETEFALKALIGSAIVGAIAICLMVSLMS